MTKEDLIQIRDTLKIDNTRMQLFMDNNKFIDMGSNDRIVIFDDEKAVAYDFTSNRDPHEWKFRPIDIEAVPYEDIQYIKILCNSEGLEQVLTKLKARNVITEQQRLQIKVHFYDVYKSVTSDESFIGTNNPKI